MVTYLKNRRIVAAVCVLLLAPSAFSFSLKSLVERRARSAQELIPAGHWLYDALMAISLENRALNFADSAPLSIQELQLYLKEIDYDALSDAGKTQYDRIFAYFDEKKFTFGTDLLTLGVEPSVNLSGFFKTEDDIDWVYDRYSRKPFFDAPVQFSLGDYAAMSMEISLGSTKGAAIKPDVYSNFPYDFDNMDVNFPYSSYFNAGTNITEHTGVAFQIVQGPQEIGRTQGGSIIWSDHLTGITTAKLIAYSPYVKYTGTVSQFNVDKYMYMHGFDVRLFKKFTFSAMEGMLVNAPMELRFLNPWTIFHGFAPWRDYGDENGIRTDDDPESHTCAYLGIKAEYTPIQYLRLYGLFAMTQYATPYEKIRWPDSKQPDGMGGQWGAEAYVPQKEGYLHFALEASYTQPFLYIKESPNWTLARTYSENMGDKAVFYEWIGSPYGPDTISAHVTGGYEQPGKYSVDATYLFMCRGEMSGTSVFDAIDWGGQATDQSLTTGWVYPNSDEQTDAGERKKWSTPHGIPEYVNRVSVLGTWQAKPWLKVSAQPAYVFVYNAGHQSGVFRHGFEIAFALECSFIRF